MNGVLLLARQLKGLLTHMNMVKLTSHVGLTDYPLIRQVLSRLMGLKAKKHENIQKTVFWLLGLLNATKVALSMANQLDLI